MQIILGLCLYGMFPAFLYAQSPPLIDISKLDSNILLDIRYATSNNFTGKKIYDCPACYVQPALGKALKKASRNLQLKGLRLKVFDCYRPAPYQKRLWDAKPDANYVTPPWKGSQHSKGYAIDCTIVDAQGKELDMGTPYDDLSTASHWNANGIRPEAKKNRILLRQVLEQAGLKGIRTEWWHFSLPGPRTNVLSWLWPCD